MERYHSTLEEMKGATDAFLRDGVTPEELDQARQGWLQSANVSFSSDTALVGLLSSLSYAGRTMTWEAGLEEKIKALTPDGVKQIWFARAAFVRDG
jgi:predicted Zn-dependent peptidase